MTMWFRQCMLSGVNSSAAFIPTRSEKQAMDWSLVLISQGIEAVIEHQPETASRFNLSRTGLVKRWLSKFWS